MSVVETALGKLRAEFVTAEKPGLFEMLKPALSGEKLDRGYAEVATEFGLSESAVKVAVHRMRKRFGEVLRGEVIERSAIRPKSMMRCVICFRRWVTKPLKLSRCRSPSVLATPNEV